MRAAAFVKDPNEGSESADLYREQLEFIADYGERESVTTAFVESMVTEAITLIIGTVAVTAFDRPEHSSTRSQSVTDP